MIEQNVTKLRSRQIRGWRHHEIQIFIARRNEGHIEGSKAIKTSIEVYGGNVFPIILLDQCALIRRAAMLNEVAHRDLRDSFGRIVGKHAVQQAMAGMV